MKREDQFIEDVGVYFESQGVPRMAGRLLAWLLICDPPEQTMNDMVSRLQVSKGSASSMLRMLGQFQLVERISRPGVRADFYRIAPDFGEKVMSSAMQKFAVFRMITERGLRLLEDAPPERRERLEDLHSIYTYLEGRFPSMAQEWREQRAEERSAAGRADPAAGPQAPAAEPRHQGPPA
jgi:DNA-binding transcriptional regulator GbsR (MarR family)